MQNLTSADLICVGGKPTFTFRGIKELDPRTLIGQRVFVDGLPYHVLRAETYAVMDPTGMNFGLMVKRATEAELV